MTLRIFTALAAFTLVALAAEDLPRRAPNEAMDFHSFPSSSLGTHLSPKLCFADRHASRAGL